MKIAISVAAVGVLAMGAALAYGFAAGDFAAEGNTLLGMPWGVVSLVDVYTGIALAAGWVVFRERSVWRSVVWIVLMVVLGFFSVALYTLLALLHSGGSWERFFLGNRSGASIRAQVDE
jgi:hypothetical protein